jgi:general secretion pathway protein H
MNPLVIRHSPFAVRHSHGFTLLEVIVVLAVMSLSISLGAVYFAGDRTSSRVAGIAREVSGVIKHGRALAAETGEAQSVVFDLESRTYGIEGRTPKRVPADIGMLIVEQFQGEISRGTYSMRILPSGGIQGGVIVLRKGQASLSIHPDPIVGVTVVKQ